jgi:hypothetical protein
MPKKRIPPSERLSKQILDLMQNLNTNGNNQELLNKLMQLSMRKTIQEILEQEVSEHIGKGYYEQGDNRNGHRNGYKPAHIRTTEDKLLVERPQVDDPSDPFRSNTWKHIKGNTERLAKIGTVSI